MSRARAISTCLIGLIAAAPAAGQSSETYESATWLLRRATLPQANGAHNVLLRALRQMNDPQLKPMFEALRRHEHPALKIHGLLGLAEVARPRRLEPAALSAIPQPAVRAQVVASGLKSGLIDHAQAQRLVSDPAMDAPVKVIAAATLMASGELKDLEALRPILTDANLAVRGTAAMILLQAGGDGGLAALRQIDADAAPNRDGVRAMLMQTAVQHEFDRVGPWALAVAEEPGAPRNLRLAALRAGLRLHAPNAQRIWSKQYGSAESVADRILLAMIALAAADRVNAPTFFDPMIGDELELIRDAGAVGRLIAAEQPAQREIFQLLQHNHLLAGKWAMDRVRELSPETGRPLAVALILTAERDPNPDQHRDQRLANAVFATQHLAEKDPQAKALLFKLFSQSPPLTQEAMLMGLIRSQADAPYDLLGGFDRWASETARSMSLLLKAKHGAPLQPQDVQRLDLIVRGGAGLEAPLRVQAAWIYLKRTGQQARALAEVTQPS